MSNLGSTTIATACPVVTSQASVESLGEKNSQDVAMKPTESESETDTDSYSDEENTTDDDRFEDNNPVLKERLKQLDRYATPINHENCSPGPNSDLLPVSNLYSKMPFGDSSHHHTGFSAHKSSVPSEAAESSSTISDHRFHQHSIIESPNACSGPASINTSVTPKQNFSPSGGVLSSGNSGSQEHFVNGPPFQNLSNKFSRAGAYSLGSLCDGPQNPNLSNDLYLNNARQEFICDVCRGVYSSRSSLQNHMKKHLNCVVKRHQCDYCPYSTQYAKNLFKHIESMHTSVNPKQFRCDACYRSFPSEKSLQEHDCVISQCSTYRCDECGRVFKTKLRLKYHADIHNPRKPYVCDVEGCDRAFRTPKYLKNHRDEFHRMQPKNYLCPVEGCDLIFHRKTHLKRHVATHDESEKKYHCQWPNCQRRFCSEETLSLHYRKHTGEKPFNCALCPFNCYNKPSLNEHYRLQHAKDSSANGQYKDQSCSSPRLNSFHSVAPENSNERTSTPGPLIRHRMVDILESCGSHQPGPLDAEINGILDSLDKESDLPDLFNSGTFDFDQTNHDARAYRPPKINKEHSTPLSDRPIVASPMSFQNADTSAPGSPLNRTAFADDSLTNVLTTVLTDLQRAESTGSLEEFEKAKANALSSLPTFTTGAKLDEQIDEIVNELIASISTRSEQTMLALFRSTRPLNREETFMVESLEHQLMNGNPLTAPTPPRRRGRRPKLQQQLQPYLEKLFSIEPSTAEAMATHLVSVSQRERGLPVYDDVYGDGSYFRIRGRGRGYRMRGRSGRPLSISTHNLPDSMSSRGHPFSTSIRGALVSGRRLRGGIRSRFRVERSFNSERHMISYNDAGVDFSRSALSSSGENPMTHHNDLSSHNLFINSSSMNEELNGDTSVRLRVAHDSSSVSDEELDELEEADEQDIRDGNYELMASNGMASDHHISHSATLPSVAKNSTKANRTYQTEPHSVVNQDTLGEMLEDLGVIVKRIGERAANAIGKPPYIPASSPYHAPSRESFASINDRFTTKLDDPVNSANRSDPLNTTVQLPSMAILASANGGTPVSAGGSTPGRLANAECISPSPRASSYPMSHYPTSVNSQEFIAQSQSSGAHDISDDHQLTPNNCQTKECKSGNDFSRNPPMWSCESMCCTGTPDDQSAIEGHCNSTSNRNGTSDPYHASEGMQLYRPTDLSTRMSVFTSQSSSNSPNTHLSPEKSMPLDSNYSVHLSSNVASMGSLMSAVEAVDHLRSLSALGAKYTATMSSNESGRQDTSNSNTFTGYQYHNSCRSPLYSNQMESDSPCNTVQSNAQDIFVPPNMPSTLNTLLSHRKSDSLVAPPLNLPHPTIPRGSPSKVDFQAPSQLSGPPSGSYSPYNPNAPGRGDQRGEPNSAYSFTPTIPNCSPASSSSSSARSYLHDLYQREQHYQHQQQQQQQQQAPLAARSPAYDLTTRQLLSEAAATAYAHGLGRCDGQMFMSGLPAPPHPNHSNSPQSNNAYNHQSGQFPTTSHFPRYHQNSESSVYSHVNDQGFSNSNDFSGSSYGQHVDPYSFYQQHLRQTHPLSRSAMEHGPSQTAAHLAHSIHEVSGLGVAEAAAAAAYAYHQYHQQQQQQQAHRHNQSANTNYPNLFNTRGYGPLDEHFTPRDLALYTAAHSERRDPKSTYLAENYRNSQSTAGRFLF